MRFQSVSEICLRGRELYGGLLEEAVRLLRNIDSRPPEDLAGAIERRYEYLEQIREVEDELANMQAESGKECGGICRQTLDDFRSFQKSTIQSVLEIDALVTALAQDRLNLIRGEIASLARGRSAIAGYGGAEDTNRRILSGAA